MSTHESLASSASDPDPGSQDEVEAEYRPLLTHLRLRLPSSLNEVHLVCYYSNSSGLPFPLPGDWRQVSTAWAYPEPCESSSFHLHLWGPRFATYFFGPWFLRTTLCEFEFRPWPKGSSYANGVATWLEFSASLVLKRQRQAKPAKNAKTNDDASGNQIHNDEKPDNTNDNKTIWSSDKNTATESRKLLALTPSFPAEILQASPK